MQWRNKWVFWGALLSVLTLCAIPSLVLLQAFERYRRFLAGFSDEPLRASPARTVPHGRPQDHARAEPPVRFVPFRLTAPKAKRVSLTGDFLQWRPEALPMTAKGSGWEVSVPLPPGRYRYLFWVDGRPTVDPDNPELAPGPQRAASVRTVR